METVLERSTVVITEEEQHNAMINERYRKLLDAVEDQFSASAVEERAYAPTFAPEAPVYEATPVVEQAPTVTEYTPSTLAASVFTAEKLERVEKFVMPVQEQNATATQTKAIVKATPSSVAQYSLTPFAKIAMAVFTLVVLAMLTLIGINSQIIQRKAVRIQNLEEKKQELTEQNEEIQRRIQELQTEESIIQRATQAGLLN